MKKLIAILLPLTLFATAPKSVVCVHGFLGDSWNWAFYQKHLSKDGYRVIMIDYPSTEKTIENHAKDLVYELAQIAAELPGSPIDFVAHSMGSLVLRAAMNDPLCPQEAKTGKVVLLAPPNQGSTFARKTKEYPVIKKILATRSGRELSTKESFDDLGPFPSTTEVLVIAGTFGLDPWTHQTTDGKVSVEETRLPTSHQLITINCGHTSILLSKKALRATRSFLTNQQAQKRSSTSLPYALQRAFQEPSKHHLCQTRYLGDH